MNKKILLFSLVSVSAFAATTGNFEIGMETMPKMNAEKKWEVKYTVPFKASFNVENTGFSAGIEGKYNKEKLINTIDLLGFSDTKLFANYTFNKGNDNEVTLGIENEIELSSTPENKKENKKFTVNLGKLDTNFKLDYTKNLSETDKFNFKTVASTYLLSEGDKAEYGFKGIEFGFGMHNVVKNVTVDSELKFKHLRKFELPLIYKKDNGVLFGNLKTNHVYNTDKPVLSFSVEGSQQQQIDLNKVKLTFKEGFVVDEYRGKGISSALKETDNASFKNESLDKLDKDYRIVSKNKFYLNSKLEADIYSVKLEAKVDNSLEFALNNYQNAKIATKDAEVKDNSLSTYNSGNVKITIDPSIKISKDFNLADKVTVGVAAQASSKQELYVSEIGVDKDSFLKNDVKVSLTGSVKAQLVEGLTANLTVTPEAVFESNEYIMNKKEGKADYKLSFKEFTPKVYFGIQYNW